MVGDIVTWRLALWRRLSTDTKEVIGWATDDNYKTLIEKAMMAKYSLGDAIFTLSGAYTSQVR